ncbi:MAG: anthranilate synthase component I family protein [Microthrixaceae bacterium]
MAELTAYAFLGGNLCTDLIDSTADLSALDSEGFWVVVIPFEGDATCLRFGDVRAVGDKWGIISASESSTERAEASGRSKATGRSEVACTRGVELTSWSSSLNASQFTDGVERIRAEIADGQVYQVNLTRTLTATVPKDFNMSVLSEGLRRLNPAPYEALISIPELDLAIASASPELFLARNGRLVRSSPIKGTASTPEGFLDKDLAENIMIVDLVRNDLGRVCEWGSVHVADLLKVESHPGLHHLVSTIEGTLLEECGWSELIDATFPPGSVTGAPKIAALELIEDLEPTPRDIYCGSIGWVDADRAVGELNVAIRTFWLTEGILHLGTGGGITYDSSADGEWAETVLKADRLLSVAARSDARGTGLR